MRNFADAAQVLGELEQRLMDVLWQASPLTVREMRAKLGRTRLAYTTVMTTLDRLYKKGLLARAKQGLAYAYQPAMDRSEYHRRVVAAAVTPLLEQGSAPVLAAFVDAAAGVDDDNLARLEQLIAARRRKP